MSDDTPRDLGDLTYQQLRRIAAARMRVPGNITLQPTALVHEVWLKVADQAGHLEREHFLSLAARAMRQIIIDHARARGAAKRGGGQLQVSLTGVAAAADGGALTDVLALDAVLTRLAELDPRRARVVELRFFGGLTNEEIARETGSSVATVERDWRAARAWLHAQLQAPADD
ncbi:MAG: ECF-type sigma factor [bacterium]